MSTRLFLFYTDGNEYEEMAEECRRSFWRFGLVIQMAPMLRRDTWMQTCLTRSIGLHKLAQDYPNDTVGLVDADLKCLKPPDKLLNFKGDVAVHDLGEDDPHWIDNKSARYSAGVLLFAPTLLGRSCLSNWAAQCENDLQPGERTREQVYLYDAITALRQNGGKVFNIGVDYNQPVSDKTVIVHLVASRRMREKMGGAL